MSATDPIQLNHPSGTVALRSSVLFQESSRQVDEVAADATFSTDEDLVSVVVSGTTFVMLKSRISRASAYFNAAFNGEFVEAATRNITVKETDVDTFDMFAHWVKYSEFKNGGGGVVQMAKLFGLSRLIVADSLQHDVMRIIQIFPYNIDAEAFILLADWDATGRIEVNKSDEHTLLNLGKLFNLAKKAKLPILQNLTIDALHPLMEEASKSQLKLLIDYIYDNSVSKLKLLVIQRLARGSWVEFNGWRHYLSSDMTFDLAVELREQLYICDEGDVTLDDLHYEASYHHVPVPRDDEAGQ